MEARERPIVVFDSGVGGVSVLRALVKELPGERFVYFGDSANAPYGPRTTEEIRSLTLENLRRLDAEYGFKAAVIACNTATSAAISELRAAWPDRPIVGIEPALKLAADRNPGGTILVMATETTLREEKFAALTRRVRAGCTVIGLPCPELVEFVERGELSGDALRAYLSEKLLPYRGAVDAVVLGCTHFPFVKPMIREVLGDAVALYDGAEGTARETRAQLERRGLLNPAETPGTVTIKSSLGPAGTAVMERLFQTS